MIRTLQETDAEEFVALRHEALRSAPLAFSSSPGDDRFSSVAVVRDKIRGDRDSIIFGAFQPQLVGTLGTYRESRMKTAHKMFLWGMYVAPDHRGQRLASQLLQAALDHARQVLEVSWIQLSVSSAAPVAKRLYEHVGFQVWGKEPAGLQHGGQSIDQYHMALRLR